MSFSPKQSRFSVSDLLGSAEDGYRRFGGMDLGTALGAHRQPQAGIQNPQNPQQHHLPSSSAPPGPTGTGHAVSFPGAVGGFCNGGTGTEPQSYQEPGFGSAWFGGPEPRFSQSKNPNRTRTWTELGEKKDKIKFLILRKIFYPNFKQNDKKVEL